MLEQVDTKVAADLDEGAGGHPAGEPPQQVVAGDKRQQEDNPRPQLRIGRVPRPEQVDQVLDPILRSDRAADGRQHGSEHDRMTLPMSQHVMQQKPAGAMLRELGHGHRRAYRGANRTLAKPTYHRLPPPRGL